MEERTKIVATIGPATANDGCLRNLVERGVDVFRFNLKHNDLNWHREWIKRVRQINKEAVIMIDLQGSELRIEVSEELEVKSGEIIYIASQNLTNKKTIKIKRRAIDRIRTGDQMFVADGNLELRVIAKRAGVLEAVADHDFVIKNGKSLNVPGRNLGLPFLTQKDKQGLDVAKALAVDWLALSFVKSSKDVDRLRRIIGRRGLEAKIVAKIENQKALTNLDEIIEATDGIMIARGDLGVEVPLQELAWWQKEIIRKCRMACKPVIVATQMLGSMVENIRPSRAEVSDVANAVFDGADALMLSEETATGKYPVRAVREMKMITAFCEEKNLINRIDRVTRDETETLVEAAAGMIEGDNEFRAAAIAVFTQSGRTARIVASYRLPVPVVAITSDERVAREISLAYGIRARYIKLPKKKFDIESPVFAKLADDGNWQKGERIVVIHGNNWLGQGSTSSISIKTV